MSFISFKLILYFSPPTLLAATEKTNNVWSGGLVVSEETNIFPEAGYLPQLKWDVDLSN